jgi:hypothetical protein
MLDAIGAEILDTNLLIAKRTKFRRMNSIKCSLRMTNITCKTKRYFASNVRGMATMQMYALPKLFQGMKIATKVQPTLFKKEL